MGAAPALATLGWQARASIVSAPVAVSLAVMIVWGATPVVARIATDLEPLWVAAAADVTESARSGHTRVRVSSIT